MDSMMNSPKKRGRPPKKQQPADAPAVSLAEPVVVERRVVPPAAHEPQMLFELPIPAGLLTSAIPTDSLPTMPADVRLAIQARLGTNFTLDKGVMKTRDGRQMRVEVTDAVRVFSL